MKILFIMTSVIFTAGCGGGGSENAALVESKQPAPVVCVVIPPMQQSCH